MSNITVMGKLPFGRALNAALSAIKHNFAKTLVLAIIPSSVTALLLTGFIRFLMFHINAGTEGYFFQIATNQYALSLLIMVATASVGLIFLSVFTCIPMLTAWHRYTAQSHEYRAAELRFKIGANERTYLLKALQIVAIWGVTISLLIFAVRASIEDILMREDIGIESLIFLLGIAFLVYLVINAFILRLVLILPAAANGQSMSLQESWDATQGNTIRLFFSVFCISVIFGIVSYILEAVFGMVMEQLPITSMTASLFLEFLVLAFVKMIALSAIAVLFSAAYQHLIDKKTIVVDRSR